MLPLTPSRWLRPSLAGVLVLVVLVLVVVFVSLFERSHRGPRMAMPEPGILMDDSNGMTGMTQAPMGRDMMEGSTVTMESKAASPMMSPMATSRSLERHVATRASLELRVQSIDWTVGKVREIAESKGGYVENSSVNRPEFSERSAWMNIKVPAKDFQVTFDELKKNLFYVIGESLSGTDMTESVINVTSRLNNKRAEEATLRELLSRSNDISDVIKVTDRLTEIRSEIESLEAMERSLANETEMASIALSMTEDPQVVADTTDLRSGNVFKRAVNELITGLTQIGSGFVLLLVAGVPIFLIYFVILWIIYFFTKKAVKKFFDR